MKWVLKCVNKANCEFAQHDRQVSTGRYTLKFDKKRKRMFPVLDEELKCPVCGEPLQWSEQYAIISNFGVATFSGLPDEAKKQVLRERFDSDNRRTGNDVKVSNHRRAIEKMIGYDK